MIQALLSALQTSYITWAIVFGIVTIFELLDPRERHSLQSRLYGVGYWVILSAASVLLAKALAPLWAMFDVQPLLNVSRLPTFLGNGVIVAILGSLLGATLHDFFFYWYHRIQHQWLWRWHAVHHSVNRLNAATSYHHISETVFSVLLLQIPASLLLSDVGPTLPLLNLLLWCHNVWIHSPTMATLGPLRIFFADNRFHRIHHSLEERHFDKNFGAFTSIWDRIFGTCHMPEKDEWPNVGLAEVPEPMSFHAWFTLPGRIGKNGPSPPRWLDPSHAASRLVTEAAPPDVL